MKELIVEAKKENLEQVQSFVRTELSNCTAKEKNQVAIVVDEIFSNIAQYAYNGGGGSVIVRAKTNGELWLEFEDTGLPFDPLMQADPDTGLGADERGVGGLGIFMVKSLMDEVTYRREGQRNVLTLRKNRTQ